MVWVLQVGILAICLLAAFAYASAAFLRHASARQIAPFDLRATSVVAMLRAMLANALWRRAMLCDAAGLALQIAALHLWPLAAVQPLLVTTLLFAMVLRHRQRRLTGAELRWLLLLCSALSAVLLMVDAGRRSAETSVDRGPAAIAAAVGLTTAAVCVELGRRQRLGGRRAALLGVAVGAIHAGTAALLKSVGTNHGLRSIVIGWPLYAALALGLTGLVLNQFAFQAGPLTASLPAISTVDPLVSIAIGVVVYDEAIAGGFAASIVFALLLITLSAAIIGLTRQPDVGADAIGDPSPAPTGG